MKIIIKRNKTDESKLELLRKSKSDYLNLMCVIDDYEIDEPLHTYIFEQLEWSDHVELELSLPKLEVVE